MRGGTRSPISTFASLTIVVALAGCSSGTWQFWNRSSPEPTTRPAVATAEPTTPTAHPAAAVEAEAAVPPASSRGFTELPGLGDVRFRPGQLTVAQADQKTLDALVRWLKEHSTAGVMIEGHTDDLGTREGNLATAEKRAASIKSYLVATGIEAARISITPVGSDRPLCVEKTDACRARNRRAHFLVKER